MANLLERWEKDREAVTASWVASMEARAAAAEARRGSLARRPERFLAIGPPAGPGDREAIRRDEAARKWNRGVARRNLEKARRMPWGETFADRLPVLRMRAGLSQVDLAAALGAWQSRVAKWEKGYGDLRLHDALRLCDILDVELAVLCDPDAALPSTPFDHARLRKACTAGSVAGSA
jgi:ribosome-binding protein aMBF1 (putative translation factor)